MVWGKFKSPDYNTEISKIDRVKKVLGFKTRASKLDLSLSWSKRTWTETTVFNSSIQNENLVAKSNI